MRSPSRSALRNDESAGLRSPLPALRTRPLSRALTHRPRRQDKSQIAPAPIKTASPASTRAAASAAPPPLSQLFPAPPHAFLRSFCRCLSPNRSVPALSPAKPAHKRCRCSPPREMGVAASLCTRGAHQWERGLEMRRFFLSPGDPGLPSSSVVGTWSGFLRRMITCRMHTMQRRGCGALSTECTLGSEQRRVLWLG